MTPGSEPQKNRPRTGKYQFTIHRGSPGDGNEVGLGDQRYYRGSNGVPSVEWSRESMTEPEAVNAMINRAVHLMGNVGW